MKQRIPPHHTVLLVEDEESLLDVLRLVLEANGYNVLTAMDGEEAVRVFEQERSRIAVVLSDMGLPRLGGWDALIRIKEIDPDAKVILASGFYETKLREEVLAAGAIDFIQKPYVPDIVLRRIADIIAAEPTSPSEGGA
jgi:two-component system cell cycle sensor histidine kinase/response regulator CckA